jgi:hypothetical protein
MGAILASGVAPYVSTMAGVLMPVRAIARIDYTRVLGYKRFDGSYAAWLDLNTGDYVPGLKTPISEFVSVEKFRNSEPLIGEVYWWRKRN